VLKSLKSTTLSICISCISHWFCWLQLFILTAVEECGDGRTKWGSFKPDAFGLVIIVPNADNHYRCITPTITLDPKKDRSDPHSIQIPSRFPQLCAGSQPRGKAHGMKGWRDDLWMLNCSTVLHRDSAWFSKLQWFCLQSSRCSSSAGYPSGECEPQVRPVRREVAVTSRKETATHS
jgi:hypothetical protein